MLKLSERRMADLLNGIAERCAALAVHASTTGETTCWVVARNDLSDMVHSAVSLCETLELAARADQLRELGTALSKHWRHFLLPGLLPQSDESTHSDRLARLTEAVKALGEYALDLLRSIDGELTAPGKAAVQAGKPCGKRKRGRPVDTNPDEDKRIADGWATGSYTTKAEMAKELGGDCTASKVTLAIDRHRKRISRAESASDK